MRTLIGFMATALGSVGLLGLAAWPGLFEEAPFFSIPIFCFSISLFPLWFCFAHVIAAWHLAEGAVAPFPEFRRLF
jgi:hypothetical protein